MMDWLTDNKNKILAIGAIIVSTAFFGWLFYLVIVCDWWTWLCWVLGILIVLLWLIVVAGTCVWYLSVAVIGPEMQKMWSRIKDSFGVSTGSELIDVIFNRLGRNIQKTVFGD